MTQSKLVNATRTKNARTANQALTHSTSLNNCVDMFFLAGASRNMSESDIIQLFERARAEEKLLAYKILFWARDVRGGAGERRFFRIIWTYVLNTYPEDFNKLFTHVPEYGRWDDLFFTAEAAFAVKDFVKENLVTKKDKLLAKWLPRKGEVARLYRDVWEMSPKQYRKTLSTLSETVEQIMCEKQWGEITYSHVPSVAMNKYRKAFFRNDEARFRSYLGDVEAGDDKINADVLFPHSLYEAWKRREDAQAINVQWNALPDYMSDSDERILPVCDVSGSMTGLPMSVSVSLGVYISERNKGIFENAFVTFSSKPTMQYLQGHSVVSRFEQLERAHWEMNTNLQAVFDLLLTRAIQEGVPEEDMPTKILIISDMEFDQATRRSYYGQPEETNLEAIRDKYNRSGYEMPQVVFWNVNGRLGNSPATFTDQGIGLVSGFSPSILKGILAGTIVSPELLMRDVIESERYEPIKV
jgi:hypothetical protein